MNAIIQQVSAFSRIVLLTAIVLAGEINSYSQAGFPLVYGDQVIYYPKLHGRLLNMDVVKRNLDEALKKVGSVYDIQSKQVIAAKDVKNIFILEDRIQIEMRKGKRKYEWMYASMDDSTMFFFGKLNAGNYVLIPSVANFAFPELYYAQQFADAIYALQYPAIDRLRDSVLHAFYEKAPASQEIVSVFELKPELEELLIKADSAVQRNDYSGAIHNYLKAREIVGFGYPDIYSNLALLYAQMNFFDYAILYMKMYLRLEPGDSRKRAARDKIYEWEGLINY